MPAINSDVLAWEKGGGLLPAIIQDANTSQVLMLGYMNADALSKTLDTKKVTFYSRSKHRLWTCLLYTSPSPRDLSTSRMPSSA